MRRADQGRKKIAANGPTAISIWPSTGPPPNWSGSAFQDGCPGGDQPPAAIL